MGQVERDADLGVGGDRANDVYRPAVRQHEVVRGGDGVRLARAAGRVVAP